MYGDSSQTRSFCYVSDLVEGLIRQLAEQVWVRINLGLSLVENPCRMMTCVSAVR